MRSRRKRGGIAMDKGDEIVTAINIVLNDETISNDTKIERIEAYIEVYISNNTPSMSDMI